ncbi:SubName: Full=Uncharacterized protein {ECO:0000313/EMBL:CCA77451.1} [Serendipita indica DSM 11827]|nr:SubName: Full=Uncharacterized protein {ECO:0000313/EMBL:CCA77451.1} [Serendipita indica DSM 11827]
MPNGIYHVYVKDEDMQVERPYTPINGIGVDGRMIFWIKRYPRGEVSNWIARQAGKSIEIRGPIQQWDWRKEECDEIIMIGGGTGVTAFTQILHEAFFPSRPVTTSVNARTHFTLLHCHRTPSQLPPSEITNDFAQYKETDGHRFTEKAYVDDLDSDVDDPPRGVTHGLIDKKELEKVLLQRGILKRESGGIWSADKVVRNPEKKVKVLVCGPEGLNVSMAGPRSKPNALPQIGGILGELGFEPSQIIRL